MTPKQLTRQFCLQQALHWAITGIGIPVIILLFQAKGLSLFDIGIVMAAWIGSTTLLEIPLGSVADKYGRRSTYILSLWVSILGNMLLLAANHLLSITLAATLLGAARALYSGTLDAWFYQRFHELNDDQPDNFHSALAKVNIAVTLGLAFGALIGGALPEWYATFSSSAAHGYNLNVVLIIFATFGLALFTILVFDNDKPQQHDTISIDARITTTMRHAFQHPTLKRLMQTTLVMGATLSCIENYWQPYLNDTLQSKNTIIFGLLSALYFVMAAISSWLSMPLLKLFHGSHKMLITSSRVLAAIALVLLASTASIITFSCLYLLFFFFFSLGENSESVLIHRHSDEHVRATMLSIHSCLVSLGGVVASLAFGFVSQHAGIAISWVSCGILLLLSSALLLLIPSAAIDGELIKNG
ncbi:MFS transporter [Thaumasiovibrio subtropicus]|uniref:MFS transporter n=1 Tax=Thaumasiovibrio subtropicus TaxID=1891207 RepID=UPI000B357CFC|nr:MFS transporter [Thaumasiovibrio subtropicus]